MKYILWFTLIFAPGSIYSAGGSSVQELVNRKKVKVEFTSLGGHSAYCMKASVTNLTNDTQDVWFEAGRRLVSMDSTQQDIFLVKELRLRVLPKKSNATDLFGFCCQSHDRSPVANSKFSIGFMAPEKWQKLAKIIADNNFDNDAIQQAVWAISNNHTTAGISRGSGHKNKQLIEAVAELKGEEIPWYNTEFETSPTAVFSNRPTRITGDLNYTLKNNAAITVVVKDWNDMLITTIAEEKPAHRGMQNFYIDLDINGWRDGKYTIYILADGSNLIASKGFSVNTGQVLRH
jgi:hypothetical protein